MPSKQVPDIPLRPVLDGTEEFHLVAGVVRDGSGNVTNHGNSRHAVLSTLATWVLAQAAADNDSAYLTQAAGDARYSQAANVKPTATGPSGPTYTGGAGAHQYWRVLCTAIIDGFNGGHWTVAELELRETIGTPERPTGGAAISSATYSGTGVSNANAFDGDLTTAWSSATDPSPASPVWIGYNFGAGNAKAIKEIAITGSNNATYTAPQGAQNIVIQWSDDGAAWTNQYSVNGIAWTGAASQKQVFTDPNATQPGNTTQNYPTTLAALNDVYESAAPTDGMVLTFVAADGKWEPKGPAAIAANSILGNNTAAAAPAVALTAAQVAAMLPVFTGAANGLVPASGAAGTTKFLRQDGTWAVPPSGGGGSTTLAGLTDVNEGTGPLDGQVLVYVGADSKWEPRSAAGGALIPIAVQTLGAAAASISFTGIPATYDDLILVVTGRGDAAFANINVSLQFNGDTGANYDYEGAGANNGANAPGGSYAQTSVFVGYMPSASGVASAASSIEIELPNYANTNFHKDLLTRSGVRLGASSTEYVATWGDWRSTAPINQVTLLPSSGNFVAGTKAVLYGRSHQPTLTGVTPSEVLLSSQTVSGVASVKFDNTKITSTYSTYLLRMSGVVAATGGSNLIVQLSPDNGTTIRNANYAGNISQWGVETNYSSFNPSYVSTGLLAYGGMGADATVPAAGEILLYNLTGATLKKLSQSMMIGKANDGHIYEQENGGYYSVAEAINCILVLASSGNISGTFELFGVN